MNSTTIVIFAKAPVSGQVKTRLIPALGDEGAAQLARRLLDRTLETALAAGIGPVELCASPNLTDPAWNNIGIPPGIGGSTQGDGDLGERMARAARRHLDHGAPLLIIGTDCLALTARHLREAATALTSFDAVLLPALDGGYVLLGLQRFHQDIFRGIPWGTGEVARLTLSRMAVLDWTVSRGMPLPDIDNPADLRHLPSDWHLPALTPHNR